MRFVQFLFFRHALAKHNKFYFFVWLFLFDGHAKSDFGDSQGFWTLRVLLPVLAMGICILKAIKNNEKK